ncbi:MAG: hypothetical protein KJ592_02030 [Nanoarchaeota archaeon]|nr:hypothetical protein [Nanoarchaeota archaeon]
MRGRTGSDEPVEVVLRPGEAILSSGEALCRRASWLDESVLRNLDFVLRIDKFEV